MSWISKLLGQRQQAESSHDSSNLEKAVNFKAALYKQDDIKEFTTLLCDGYVISGSFTLNEVETFVRETQNQHPENILLATLDDTDQAFYTSGHAIFSNDLNNIEGHDLSALPQHLFVDGEHSGDLGSPEEFFIRKNNFLKAASEKSIHDLYKQGWWSSQSDPLPSILTPETVALLTKEDRSYVQIVNVDHCYQALAAFPNGYFTNDFDPFENFVLSKYLYENFGFKLFGVGANYLGFMRDEALDSITNEAFSEFLKRLYDNYEGEVPHQKRIAKLLAGQTTFYLNYTDR